MWAKLIFLEASMRPRLFTAENGCMPSASHSAMSGFNEAAALHRGKREAELAAKRRRLASMRPRLFTAENQEQVEVFRPEQMLQ